MTADTWDHDVFVSYASEDLRIARAMERQLGRFHWWWLWRRPRISVFLDRNSLSGDSNLRRSLGDAVERSERFLLVCTASSADPGSWVDDEVAQFIAGRDDPLDSMLFVVEGGDGLTPEIMPASLQLEAGRSSQPLGDRLVHPVGGPNFVARWWRRRDVVCRIAAAVWGEKPEETCRAGLRNMVFLTLLVATVVVGGLGWYTGARIREQANRDELARLLAADHIQDGADYSDTRFVDFDALQNSFAGTNFSGAEIVRTNFDGNELLKATFHAARLSDVRFETVSAIDADFSCLPTERRTDCQGATLEDVVFTGESKLIDVNFNRTRLVRVTFDAVDVHDSSFVAATGSDVVFRNVDIKGVNFALADIDGIVFDRVCYDDETAWPEDMVDPLPPNIGMACRMRG